MMLPVQKFLLNHSFQDLYEKHGVEVSLDLRNGHKFSLNYSQIYSSNSDDLACDCRGLILSNGSSLLERAKFENNKYSIQHIVPGSTQILAFPMRRFFNFQQEEAVINWDDPFLSVQEKLDGTLAFVYFDQIIHEWHIATRSVPEGNMPLNDTGETSKAIFELALEKLGLDFKKLTSLLNPNFTYCFELTSEKNHNVVYYSEPKIHLLAVRNKFSTLETPVEFCKELLGIIPIPTNHSIKKAHDIVRFVNSRSAKEAEGVVVRDTEFNRIKIKSDDYVKCHKNLDLVTKSGKACLEVILEDKYDDFIANLPPFACKKLKLINDLFREFLIKTDKSHSEIFEKLEVEKKSGNYPNCSDSKILSIMLQSSDVWLKAIYSVHNGKSKNIKDFILTSKKQGVWPRPFLNELLSLIGYSSSIKK